jgi:C-type mannose receptor
VRGCSVSSLSWRARPVSCPSGSAQAEADLSVSSLPSSPAAPPEVEELWIGLNDLKLQMNFEWSDGSLVSFTHWHPFEPNNFRDSLEDCVTIWGPVRPSFPITEPPNPWPFPQTPSSWYYTS